MFDEKVMEQMMVMAEMHNKKFTEAELRVRMEDLSAFNAYEIISSLKHCRMQINRFPTTADIVSNIPRKIYSPPELSDDSVVTDVDKIKGLVQQITKTIKEK